MKYIMILPHSTQVQLEHEVSGIAMPQILLEFSSKAVTELLEVRGIWTGKQEKVNGEQG